MTIVLTLDPLLQGFGPVAKAFGLFPGMDRVCRSYASTDGREAVQVPMTDNVLDPDGIRRDVDTLYNVMGHEADEDEVIVFGYSRGAQVACQWLRKYGPFSLDLVDRVRFVLIGNPERGIAFGSKPGRYLDGSTLKALPTDTPFSVRDIARSGDAYADPADTLHRKPWWKTGGAIHCDYRDVDLTPPVRGWQKRVGNISFEVVR